METPHTQTRPSFSRRAGRALGFMALGALFGVALIAGGAYWKRDTLRGHARDFLGMAAAPSPPVSAEGEAAPADDRLGAIEQQLQQLHQQVDTLTSVSAAPAGENAGPSETLAEWEKLKPRLTEAMQKLQELQSGQTLEASALRKDFISLQEALLGLQNDVNGIKASMPDLLKMEESLQAQRNFSVLVSFIHLRDKALAGKPFSIELAGFRSVLEDPLELKTPLTVLEQHAAGGVPTAGMLTRSFQPLLHQALGTDEDGNQSLVSRTLGNLRKVVIIRHVGEDDASDQSPEAILSRIEKLVAEGEMAAVPPQMEKLPAATRAVFKDWETQLTRRVALEGALEMVFARITASGEPQASPETTPEAASPNL